MKKNGIIILGIALLVGLAYGVNYARSYALIGSSYNAKTVCSCMFVSGRNLEEIKTQDLYAIPFSNVNVDSKEQSVSVDIYGFAKVKALFRKGKGCTIVNDISVPELLSEPARITNSIKEIDFEDSDATNIDSAAIVKAINEAFVEVDTNNVKRTRAIFVLYKGKMIGEKYADGITKNTPLLGWSMTKSVTNAMIGLMIKDGKLSLKSPAPLTEWKNDDRNKITIDHILRMSSCLQFEENYAAPSDATEMLFTSKNSGLKALSSLSKSAPDVEWQYQSGNTNILQEIMKRQFKSIEEYHNFPYERLFHKIGMNSAVLEQDASGTYVGSSFMYANARDWARFGQLYLQDGIWNGERLLPEGWVKYSSTETPNSKGKYAAHFWLMHDDYPQDSYSAQGFEGQFVSIIPSKELVIVRLGCTPGNGYDHPKFVKQVIAAVQ